MRKSSSFCSLDSAGGHGVENIHILTEPIDVGGLNGDGQMLAAQDVAQPFDGDGQIHNKWESDREGGTKAVPAAKLDQRTASSFIHFRFVEYETLA